MKRLTGMKRFYIVISALYFLISSTIAMIKVSDSQYYFTSIYYDDCVREATTTSPQQPLNECWKTAIEKSKSDNLERRAESIVVFAVIPLLLFWVLSFLLAKVYKWVETES